MSETSWRHLLLLNRDARTDAVRAEHARRAAAGELRRLSAGAYLPAHEWPDDPRRRLLWRMRVVAARALDPIVFCGASAAAAWGLPWFGPWPDRVDVVRTQPGRGQYAQGVSRHLPQGELTVVELDGLLVTSLARTVVDLSRQRGFVRAVVAGDAALNPATRASFGASGELTAEDLRAEARRGALAQTRALDVIDFLDGRAASAGESISRISIWRAGLPAPVLQQEFPPWTVDFWWPEHGVIGEFDGATKYLDAAKRGGRTPEQVLYDEKLREDDLRRRVRGFARWKYRDALSPLRMADRLRAAGVPAPRRQRFAALSTL